MEVQSSVMSKVFSYAVCILHILLALHRALHPDVVHIMHVDCG